MSIRPITTQREASPAPVMRGDAPNFRRIRAELVQIRAELERSSAVNTPVVRCLGLWHQEFQEALSHPDTDQVIRHFQRILEEIFENPLNPQAPFSPKLFGTETLPLVQFMVAKMRDHNSLLYSARVDAATPPPENPRDIFERISAVQAEHLQTQQQQMPEFQQLRQRLIARRQAQEGKMQAIEGKIKQLNQLKEEIQATRTEQDHLKNTVERLERETAQHKENVVKLEPKLTELRKETDAVARENIQLESRTNRLEAAIKEEKSSWLKELGCFALTIAVRIALNYVAPGADGIVATDGVAGGMTWGI